MPHDADGTLQRIRGRIMRVGVIANRPWVVDRGTIVEGVEGHFASDIARIVGARIEWVRMPEFELIRALRKRELDLVIGGFDAQLPWAQEVAFTRPYLESDDGKAHVLAAPPGENAWLMLIDGELESHKTAMRAELGR